MAEYSNPVDIANRALQHCGERRIDPTIGFEEDSVQATECGFAYGKVRRAELRRNVWRFAIKWAVLRAITETTREIAPAMWSSSTIYPQGAIVSDEQGIMWISVRAQNLNNNPGTVYYWELYTGPLAIPKWVDGEAYYAGGVIYTTPGDGTFKVYQSLIGGNEDNPATPNAYDATVEYRKEDLVVVAAVVYQSIVDFNLNNAPAGSPGEWRTTSLRGTGSEKWVELVADLIDKRLVYPSTHDNRHVFRLPANYVRVADQEPKAGVRSPLGAPSNYQSRDWNLEGDYLTSYSPQAIVFRFAADIQNVTMFDDLFCEGLAARLALAVTGRLSQSNADVQSIAAQYSQFISDARTVNGIEKGPVEAPEDDFISIRV